MSVAATGTHSARWASPGLPGAAMMRSSGLVLLEPPGQRVLATPAADDEDGHELRERLLEVGDQVVDVLDAAGEPDQPLGDPELAFTSAGTDACVIDAGCLMRLSTPPSDSASEKTRTFSSTAFARSFVPSSIVIIPPKPLICRAASACCGCDASPG